MPKLDGMLTEYYKKGALSVKEMQAYDEQKTKLYDLARAVNKTIGVYYQSLDPVVYAKVTTNKQYLPWANTASAAASAR